MYTNYMQYMTLDTLLMSARSLYNATNATVFEFQIFGMSI